MDALDRLLEPAGALLRRAEAAVAASGAPEDDPLWPLLRRLRLLPADAVAGIAGWRAEPLEAALPGLRSLRESCAAATDAVPGAPPWEGAGAETYAVRWAALRAHLAEPEGPGSAGPAGAGGPAVVRTLAGRLTATIRFVEELTDWIARSRRDLANALTEVLGCAEAVTVMTGGAGAGPAAATIATHVLEVAAAAVDEGHRLHGAWRVMLVELPYVPPPVDGPAGTDRTLRITG